MPNGGGCNTLKFLEPSPVTESHVIVMKDSQKCTCTTCGQSTTLRFNSYILYNICNPGNHYKCTCNIIVKTTCRQMSNQSRPPPPPLTRRGLIRYNCIIVSPLGRILGPVTVKMDPPELFSLQILDPL